MERLSVEASKGSVKQGSTGSSVKTKSLKKIGIEVGICHEVTISQTRVKLESQKDKECEKRGFYGLATTWSDVWDRIAKADKLIERKVIMASFRHIV